jgi:hypothetical protein
MEGRTEWYGILCLIYPRAVFFGIQCANKCHPKLNQRGPRPRLQHMGVLILSGAMFAGKQYESRWASSAGQKYAGTMNLTN